LDHHHNPPTELYHLLQLYPFPPWPHPMGNHPTFCMYCRGGKLWSLPYPSVWDTQTLLKMKIKKSLINLFNQHRDLQK
jgi:hypothetical protein